MLRLLQPLHFVKRDGGHLTGQTAGPAWRHVHHTKAFTIALGLHLLLGAAVIYWVVPPVPSPKEETIIEIVQLPEPPKLEPPKPEPPKPVPPKPVVKPVPPPPKRVVQPKPAPPPPVVAAPTPPVAPAPTFIPAPPPPVQEAPEAPPVAEQAPIETPPTPAVPPVDEYIPPDSDAAYLHNPKPSYPLIAQRRGWEGTTLLEVRVSAAGKPLNVRIKKSSGYHALDDAALQTVRDSYRFEPARRNGEKVEATVELPMRFSLRK